MKISKLTPREKQIISYLVKGLTNAEIAKEIGISPHTVKAHIASILRKMRIKNRIQLAFEIGILDSYSLKI